MHIIHIIYTYACVCVGMYIHVCVCEYNVIASGIHIQDTCFPNTGMNHDEPKKGLKNRKDPKRAETTISKSPSDLASSTPQLLPEAATTYPGRMRARK